jgi:hypothetical protein
MPEAQPAGTQKLLPTRQLMVLAGDGLQHNILKQEILKIMKRIVSHTLSAVLLLALAQITFGQDVSALLKPSANDTKELSKENKSGETRKKSDASIAEATPTPTPQASADCKGCRWFEPTIATFSMRYRSITDSSDVRTMNQVQQRTVLAGKFKFDAEGKYSLNVRASSGYYFNWAYADINSTTDINSGVRNGAAGIAREIVRVQLPDALASTVSGIIRARYPNATPAEVAQYTVALNAQYSPIISASIYNNAFKGISATKGSRSKGWNLYVRQLYFSAEPVKGLELQYGSMGINKGVNTEATSFDDDGYVTGGRISIKRPDKLFFDEASVTYAYLGDIYTPNFFTRAHRVQQSNYHQFLLRKKFGTRAEVSTDYTFLNGTDTMREAIKLDVREVKVLDSVLFEAYQRIGDKAYPRKTYAESAPAGVDVYKAGKGFQVMAEKKLFKKLTLNGGYASIDRDYTVYNPYTANLYFGFSLNGDQTGIGNRVIGKANYQITSDFSVSMLATKTVSNNERYLWNKSHVNVALTYDFVKGMQRLGWFK